MAETETSVSFDPKIVLRPRSLDEVFDLTLAYLRTYLRDFRPLLLLQLGLAVGLVLLLRQGLDQSWPVTWAASFMLAPLTEKGILVFGGDHLFGNAPRLRGAYGRVLKRVFPLVLGAVLLPLPMLPVLILGWDDEAAIGFAVMVSMFWPFLLAWFIYFGAALLLEHLDLQAAFRRSSRLVSFRFGRALTFVVVAFHMRLMIVVTVEILASFIISFVLQLGTPLDTLFTHGGSYPAVVAYFLASPIIALARMFDYVDTRTRLEGWDLQVRFKALVAKERPRNTRRVA